MERVLLAVVTSEGAGLSAPLSEVGLYVGIQRNRFRLVERVAKELPDLVVYELDRHDAASASVLQQLASTTEVLVLASSSDIESPRPERSSMAIAIAQWPGSGDAVARRAAEVVRPHHVRPREGTSYRVFELVIDPRGLQASVNGADAGLSITEFRILKGLADAHGGRVTRAELNDLTGSKAKGDNALTVIVNRLRDKLEAAGAKHNFIRTVPGGYSFTPSLQSERPERRSAVAFW
jgi:DNA-binding response OmpR family regulator